MRLAFTVAYFGEKFFGSQMQPDRRTIEGEFVAACERLDLFGDRRCARLQFAGRTDRGVHARRQVCAFTTDHPDRALSVLNLQLPHDIWCTGYAETEVTFNPRSDARCRTYRYYFPPEHLDYERMDAAAALFTGTHDFTQFSRKAEGSPIRTVIAARVFEDDGLAAFEVTAESFLWNMVRRMAAVLCDVGRGKREPEQIRRLLDGEEREALGAAPPEGLILWDIDYHISFMPMDIGPGSRRFRRDLLGKYVLLKKVVERLG